jgi:hypothetical protein
MRHALPLLMAAMMMGPGAASAQDSAKAAQVKRGEYLVTISGCHDCHTPHAKGPDSFGPDMKRALSGHPQNIIVKPPAAMPEPLMAGVSSTMTAWFGPWGVSFSANLTPDKETGVLRDGTEEQFIRALRTGRHQGQGRPILPPMPWPFIGQMTDDDLKAVYAYLRQIPAVKNKVADPIPPKP